MNYQTPSKTPFASVNYGLHEKPTQLAPYDYANSAMGPVHDSESYDKTGPVVEPYKFNMDSEPSARSGNRNNGYNPSRIMPRRYGGDSTDIDQDKYGKHNGY